MSVAPIRIGLLYDFPQHDGGDSFATAVQLGIDTVALDRPVELVRGLAAGLPSGTAFDVEQKFAALERQGALAIVGPAISDNGIVVRDLADAAGLPCINYTGGAITRSEFMFHYQVGSLEEEPAVLVDHLAARSLSSVVLVHDRSPVGEGYATWFERAAAPRPEFSATDHRGGGRLPRIPVVRVRPGRCGRPPTGGGRGSRP